MFDWLYFGQTKPNPHFHKRVFFKKIALQCVWDLLFVHTPRYSAFRFGKVG